MSNVNVVNLVIRVCKCANHKTPPDMHQKPQDMHQAPPATKIEAPDTTRDHLT